MERRKWTHLPAPSWIHFEFTKPTCGTKFFLEGSWRFIGKKRNNINPSTHVQQKGWVTVFLPSSSPSGRVGKKQEEKYKPEGEKKKGETHRKGGKKKKRKMRYRTSLLRKWVKHNFLINFHGMPFWKIQFLLIYWYENLRLKVLSVWWLNYIYCVFTCWV